jgi:hypothetical protein
MLNVLKTVLSVLPLVVGSAGDGEFDRLQKRAVVIRLTKTESLWTQFPWVSSVFDEQRLAREERRPIMYWRVDDDPLERC